MYISSRMPPQFETSGLMMSTARARKIAAEFCARVDRLAGHDRNLAASADFRQRFDVVALARLLEPIRLELGERIGDVDGVHRRQTPVQLEQDVDVGADRLAHGAHDFHRVPDVLLGNVGAPDAGHRVELERGEAALHHRLRLGGVFVRPLDFVAPAVGVDADSCPAPARRADCRPAGWSPCRQMSHSACSMPEVAQ